MKATLLPFAARFSLSGKSAESPVEALVRRCQAGEPRAQREFYRQYSQAMYNVCLRMLKHEAEAEDVLQEAFLKAFQHIKRFKGDSTVGAWLKRIVVNTALNQIKKRKLDTVWLEEQTNVEPAEEEAEVSWEDVQFEIEEIKVAMQQLPEGYRIVFSLYLLEGYDHNEIADILGVSVSTSKSQYNRAKKKLKKLLQKD